MSQPISQPQPRATIPCQRHLFDLPEEVVYLNCAYMSPVLKHAAELGAAALARKCRPWTIRPEDFFIEIEWARSLFARLLGASTDDIAVTRPPGLTSHVDLLGLRVIGSRLATRTKLRGSSALARRRLALLLRAADGGSAAFALARGESSMGPVWQRWSERVAS